MTSSSRYRDQVNINDHDITLLNIYSQDFIDSTLLSFWHRHLSCYLLETRQYSLRLQGFQDDMTTSSGIVPTSFELAAKELLKIGELQEFEAFVSNPRIGLDGYESPSLIRSIFNSLWSSYVSGAPSIDMNARYVYVPLIWDCVRNIVIPYIASVSEQDRIMFVESITSSSSSSSLSSGASSSSSSFLIASTSTISEHHTVKCLEDFLKASITMMTGSNPNTTAQQVSTDDRLYLRPLGALFWNVVSDPTSLQWLIKFLVNEKIATLNEDQTIIRFLNGTNSSQGLMEADCAKLKIRRSIDKLYQSLEQCTADIRLHSKRALQEKTTNVPVALVHMKQYKRLCKHRDQLASSLSSLLDVEMRLVGMEDIVLIRDSYIAATKGLRSMREHHNLSSESIDDALLEFNEELEIVGDLNNQISQPSEDMLEDVTLEAELATLMSDMTLSTPQSNAILSSPQPTIESLNLPEAPSSTITSYSYIAEPMP